MPEWNPPRVLSFESPLDAHSWSLGAYAANYNNDFLYQFIVEPWQARDNFFRGYMIGIEADYSFAHLPYVPADLELEASVAEHYGDVRATEYDLVPVLRWKWFPWNKLIYTNLRVGALGASYTTAVSPLEILGTRNHHDSRFLNLVIFEWTFAPAPTSNWEAFLLVHHRSGIYGLIDNVTGGSNYAGGGFRVHF
jgi:hypothetical protein